MIITKCSLATPLRYLRRKGLETLVVKSCALEKPDNGLLCIIFRMTSDVSHRSRVMPRPRALTSPCLTLS